MILQYLIPALVAIALTWLLVAAQIFRYRRVSRHPWKDVFSHKATLIIYVILRILAFFALGRAFARGDLESAFCCALAIFLFSMPFLVERWFKIEFSPVMEIIVLFFIYAAEILGEVESYYVLIPGWDTALHTANGFLCAAIGFALADMLNRSDSGISLSPPFLAIVAFCFSMTVAVLWEFVEFTGDYFFAVDMQKDFIISSFHSVTLDETASNIPIAVNDIVRTIIEKADGTTVVIEGGYLDIGIRDTIKDMMVNCVGALLFSITGYIGLKFGRESKIARAFVPLVKRPKDLIVKEEISKAPIEALRKKTIRDDKAAGKDRQAVHDQVSDKKRKRIGNRK